MQVQGSNMMGDMSANSPASFWGVARSHAPSWSPSAGPGHAPSGSGGHQGAGGAGSGGQGGNSDPKMAEKLMTELQVSQYKVRDKQSIIIHKMHTSVSVKLHSISLPEKTLYCIIHILRKRLSQRT